MSGWNVRCHCPAQAGWRRRRTCPAPGAGPSLSMRPPTVTLPCNDMGAWYPNNYATSTLKPGQPTALAADLFGGLMLGVSRAACPDRVGAGAVGRQSCRAGRVAASRCFTVAPSGWGTPQTDVRWPAQTATN